MARPTKSLPNLREASVWEPLPAAIARLVTANDPEFVERVREDLKAPALKDPRQLKDSSFDSPDALVCCLEFELRNARPLWGKPHDQFPGVPDWETDWVAAAAERAEQLRGETSSPSLLLPDPCGGRFQQLLADFERWRQQQSPELMVENHLRQFLRDRFDAAVAHICEGIKNERIEAKGILVLVYGGKEHPAGLIPASAITKDMKIGADGLLYQGEYKHSPAWKSVEVRVKQPQLLSRGTPLDGFWPAKGGSGDQSQSARASEMPAGSSWKTATNSEKRQIPTYLCRAYAVSCNQQRARAIRCLRSQRPNFLHSPRSLIRL
jgi:hypothetical protein